MTHILAIASGGALGAVLRFWGINWINALLGKGFPYGTLTVNVFGSLLMGVLYVLLVDRAMLGPEWRAFLTVGCLGAFTTFSTFSMETVYLLYNGELLKAALNMVLSVILCVAAAWIGIIVTRQF